MTGRVAIGYLTGADVADDFADSLLGLLAHPDNAGRIAARIHKRSGVNVSAGRNWVAASFLAHTDAEWLLTLDADVTFDADLLDRLLAVADPRARPVVSALYFGYDGEARAPYPHLYQFIDDATAPSGVRTVRFCNYPKGLIEVIGTGAGAMLIHRDVLVRMRDAAFDPAFPWYQETSMVNDAVTGEDMTFCLRVRELGLPVYVDTRIVCGHVKPVVVDEAMFEAYRASHDLHADGEARIAKGAA